MTNELSIDQLRAKLENYLQDQSGSIAQIIDMQPLAGGASRDSWALTVHLGGERQKLVLRKDFPTTMNEDALSRRQEFLLMERAHQSGVQVARMRYLCEDPDVLGLPFFLMDFVEGISIGRKVVSLPELQAARDVLPEQLAAQLAKIHAMPVDDFDFLTAPAPTQNPAQFIVEQTYGILDHLGAKVPALEYALRWAERHAPTDPEVSFVHGDFRVGNVLVDEKGLTAVIDWEFAHLSSPIEEIGYICMRDWRFGNDHLQAGGLCPRERFVRAYESASGRAVDRAACDWWEIVGNVRWGMICLAQAERHLSGTDPSVEFASLGRKSAEMQLEALNLIQKMGW